MSESKMVTEREAVLREREAYERGVIEGYLGPAMPDGAKRFAAHRYPLPTVERPRIIFDERVDSHREFRFVDGKFQTRHRSRTSEWTEDGMDGWAITPVVIRVFADLLANPTELVEDTP